MSELTELGQVLHEEHFRILVPICGLENRISGACGDLPLDPCRAEDKQQLQELIGALDHILGHHAFEENVIFPLIRRAGQSDLAGLLVNEHGAIEPIAARLRRNASAILKENIQTETWTEFRETAGELVSEVMLHLQKEEMNVVQRMDRFLDTETDHQLAIRLAAGRPNGARAEAVAEAVPDRPKERSASTSQIIPRRASPATMAAQTAARRRSTLARQPAR